MTDSALRVGPLKVCGEVVAVSIERIMISRFHLGAPAKPTLNVGHEQRLQAFGDGSALLAARCIYDETEGRMAAACFDTPVSLLRRVLEVIVR